MSPGGAGRTAAVWVTRPRSVSACLDCTLGQGPDHTGDADAPRRGKPGGALVSARPQVWQIRTALRAPYAGGLTTGEGRAGSWSPGRGSRGRGTAVGGRLSRGP